MTASTMGGTAGFLLARIAEDAADAERAARMRYDLPTDAPWERARQEMRLGVAGSYVPHQARWSPARVLAECEVKRQIVALHIGAHECSLFHKGEVHRCEYVQEWEDCSTLLALASVYADHPDYRDEWR